MLLIGVFELILVPSDTAVNHPRKFAFDLLGVGNVPSVGVVYCAYSVILEVPEYVDPDSYLVPDPSALVVQ